MSLAKKRGKREGKAWSVQTVAQISREQHTCSGAGTCGVSYLLTLFKANQQQRETAACLKRQERSKLAAAAAAAAAGGRQSSHCKMSAKENRRHMEEICGVFSADNEQNYDEAAQPAVPPLV